MIDKNSKREEVIEALKKDGLALAHVSDELKKDLQIIGLALKQNPEAFNSIPQELLKDSTYAEWFLENSYLAFQYFPEAWKDNDSLAITALTLCEPSVRPVKAEKIFLNLSPRLKKSEEFFIKAFKTSSSWLFAVPNEIRLTKPYLLAFTKINCNFNLYYLRNNLPPDFTIDDDLALEMLKINPNSVYFISKLWRQKGKDPAAIEELNLLYLIANSAESIESNTKLSNEFYKKALKVNPAVVTYLSDETIAALNISSFIDDETMTLSLIRHDPKEYLTLDPKLQKNPKFLAQALMSDPLDFETSRGPNSYSARANNEHISTLIPEELWQDLSLRSALISDNEFLSRFIPSNIPPSIEVAKECIKANRGYYKRNFSNELTLYYLELYPTKFNNIDINLRTSKSFMQKVMEIPSVKPFADKFLREHELSVDQLILDNDQRPMIINAVENATKLYNSWYNNKATDDITESNRSKPGLKFSLTKLSWFRHGGRGQERAENLCKSISALPEPGFNIKTELDIWLEIEDLLNNPKTRYHEHSFASFLVDELKKLESSPFQNINFSGPHNRYAKQEVSKALENFLKIRKPEGYVAKPKKPNVKKKVEADDEGYDSDSYHGTKEPMRIKPKK